MRFDSTGADDDHRTSHPAPSGPNDPPPVGQRGGDSRRPGYTIEPFPVDVSTYPTAFVVAAVVPNVDARDITVSIYRNMLRIVVERTTSAPPGRQQFGSDTAGVQHTGGIQQRVVQFPVGVTPTGSTATYRDGVLEVFVPKAPPSTPPRRY